MSENDDYEVVVNRLSDTSKIPKDIDLLYRCLRCGDIIPSIPDDNLACRCDNIYIDIDMWRLDIDDYDQMEVIRKQ